MTKKISSLYINLVSLQAILWSITVMKAVVKFFRHRAVGRFLKRRKACVLPDLNKYPSVAVVLDNDQFEHHKEIEQALSKVFVMKRYTFIVYADTLPGTVMQTERYFFITKNDFDFWGMIKKDKKEAIAYMSFDMVVDFSRKSDDLETNNYIISLINSSFRVTFGNTARQLYDLVIDSKKEDSILNQIGILHRYLSMLLGK